MRRCRTSCAERIADTLDCVSRRERGGNRRTHRARHHVGSDFPNAAIAHQIAGFHLPLRRGTAGTGNHAGTNLADPFRCQSGIGNRVAHRDAGVSRGIAHEAFLFAIDFGIEINVRDASYMAAQSHFSI